MGHPPSHGLPPSAADRWWFPYLPVRNAPGDDDGEPCDVVAAFRSPVDIDGIRQAAGAHLLGSEVETLIDRAPLHWVRIRSETRATREDVVEWLTGAGLDVRYVASARRASTEIGLPARFVGGRVAEPVGWKVRETGSYHPEPTSSGRWFLTQEGLSVDRRVCGTGAGTRLAVIDDDAAQAELCELEAEIGIQVDSVPRAHSHGSLVVAWATRARTCGGRVFTGVAPDASARLYCIPKPGIDVISLPLAIARAVFDGADVIVCATYVEGANSPMLDDALEAAVRLGRGGKGTLVVLPTGREASSPRGSLHASWTLGFGEPASDPRVICIGPCGRDGGWFLWKDVTGKLHPFANRGPAVRWMAPGDDIAHPFSDKERLYHSESSGASALAAGVLLLVIAANPAADWTQVCASVDATSRRASACEGRTAADPWDTLPWGSDPDGHDAKHGYGRMDASRACMAAADPVCAALIDAGEEEASRRWWSEHAAWRATAPAAVSRAVSLYRESASFRHALKAIVRHARLVSLHRRPGEHGTGAARRQIALLLRELAVASKGDARVEANGMVDAILAMQPGQVEEALARLGEALFARWDDEAGSRAA